MRYEWPGYQLEHHHWELHFEVESALLSLTLKSGVFAQW
jgi:hypothetical protein